jgi:hypothetical protein
MGFFGSAEYLGTFNYKGLVLGSLFTGYMFLKFDLRKLMVVGLSIGVGSISFWLFMTNYYVLALSRISTGFF